MAFNWGKVLDLVTDVAVPLGTAYVGAKATEKAAKSRERGTEQAADLIRTEQQRQRVDLEPWRKAGTGAVNMLSDLSTPGEVSGQQVSNYLTELPGYDFARKEGEKAWERKYSSRSRGAGGLNSGRAGKALMRWNSDRLAGPAYGQWLNQLQTLAGYGSEGNRLLSSYGSGAARDLGNLAMGGADARAGGDVGQMGLWTQAAQNIAKNLNPSPTEQAYANYLQSLA